MVSDDGNRYHLLGLTRCERKRTGGGCGVVATCGGRAVAGVGVVHGHRLAVRLGQSDCEGQGRAFARCPLGHRSRAYGQHRVSVTVSDPKLDRTRARRAPAETFA